LIFPFAGPRLRHFGVIAMSDLTTAAGAYGEAIRFLYGLQMFGARPGLETTRLLAAQFGNPHEQLRFIHVAGTNGKGSTCAMLESIYRAAGFRVGLFTSPHLVSFRERIQVNRQFIPAADVARLVMELRAALERFSGDQHPTMFEVVTVLALRYFAEQHCDVVIWETGLGGRLDATNIVTPLVSVITNIGFDHQQWLGNTLAAIATEKAGIIKPGVPVVTTVDAPEAFAVIEATAQQLGSALTRVTAAEIATDPIDVALPGQHQQLNAALARAVVRQLESQLRVSAAQMQTGLAQVNWPGRLQLLTRANGQKVLLDGAHNPAGGATLQAAIEQLFPARARTLLLGMLADKEWRSMCEQLAPLAQRIITVPVASARTAAPEELAAACRHFNPRAEVLVARDLAHALELVATDEFVIIAGSLYLIGAALAVLDSQFRDVDDERGLNEWGGLPKTG
jgi:dihydrofolate synthase/folylpolyglutamate synthase